MNINLITSWIHPILAVIWVFPLIGIVSYFALQTRLRRLQIAAGTKSKIPPVVGKDHVQIGRWLAASVVMIALIGLAHPTIAKGFIEKQILNTSPFQGVFIILLFILTIASLVFLYRARTKQWRGIFAGLTSLGLILLGCQEWIFRRTDEWYWSHYYYGMIAAILMIISVAIAPEIYQDRSLTWRKVHTILNAIALLLFIGQGFTGIRDVAEIAFYAK